MGKMRIAFIGMQHIHLKNLSKDFNKYQDEVEIVGVADVPPYTAEELETRIQLNKPTDVEIPLWDDYKELLKQDIDAAIICTDVKGHADIVEEILDLGIHTIVEKPMALDMADAKRMYRAHLRSEAELIINWPVAWVPAFRKVKELADSGIVGDILRIQYRSPSTKGPYKGSQYTAAERSKLWWFQHDRGGGSVCDYAGYGCALTTWIAGTTAKRVAGFKKNFFLQFSDVEDYSTFTIDFGNCIGHVEGSWSTLNSGEIPTGPIVYGTEGTIVSDRYEKDVRVYLGLCQYKLSPPPTEVHPVEDTGETLAIHLLKHFREGEPLFELLTAEFNMKMMSAFDAGRRSCESGMIEMAEDPFQF